jgi:predicted DNA binding CopG/RHH family protein
MAKATKPRKIPESDSVEELARFWDTHDLTDFEDLLENVPLGVFKRKSETVIPIRLRHQEAEKVKRVAKTKGVREATLLRQWVREKLRNTSL